MNYSEEENNTIKQLRLRVFVWRSVALHTISYFIVGLIVYFLLDYKTKFSLGILAYYMKPTNSQWVVLGPAFQLIRGLVFGLALYPIREIILKKGAWLYLWLLIVSLSVVSTVGPAPGSIEGMIYTQLPLLDHLFGLPEALTQTLLFSLGLYFWNTQPKKVYNWVAIFCVLLILLMVISGVIFGTEDF